MMSQQIESFEAVRGKRNTKYISGYLKHARKVSSPKYLSR